jgi:hypothetical protein
MFPLHKIEIVPSFITTIKVYSVVLRVDIYIYLGCLE